SGVRKIYDPAITLRKTAAQLQEFFKIVADNEEFSDFSQREFYDADDKVFVLDSYSLKMRNSGKPVACEWVHVFTFRDGKVILWREHTDTAQFAEGYGK